jgi:hypothetical protein
MRTNTRRSAIPNGSLPNAGRIIEDFEFLSPSALLDDKQIGELVGCKPGTVKSWRARGLGPKFVYLNGKPRASVGAVRNWLTKLPGTPTN